MHKAIHDSTRSELDSIFEQRETLSSIRLRGEEEDALPTAVVPLHAEREATESLAA